MKKLLVIYILSYFSQSALFGQELTAEKIYAKINDAVVTIYTFDVNGKILSQGSGVVLNEKGWVVTNYHVYAGANKLIVKHKEKIVEYSSIIGLDVEKDILILKIADKSFPSITLGNSDVLKIGQKNYTIGSPMGFENTISEGIVSGLRSYKERDKSFVQISASISPGSSGGAVVNSKGELIGLTTLTLTNGQNLNFAIPVNEVLAIYKQAEVKQKELLAAEFLNKGLSEYNQKNYDAAFDNFKKAIDINPKYSYAYYCLGKIFAETNDLEKAIISFNAAIFYDPKYSDAYNGLGNVYSQQEKFETAITYYNKAVDIDSRNVVAYYNLGHAYYDKNDFESAVNYYKKAILIDPEYIDAYNNLGIIYSKKGEFETALMYLNSVITINPQDPEANYNLGVVYGKKEEIETAISYYKKAIVANPNYANAYNNLGVAYLKKNEFETAITYLKSAITINPKNARAYYVLGMAYGLKGDANMENYYYEKAFELDPSLKKN